MLQINPFFKIYTYVCGYIQYAVMLFRLTGQNCTVFGPGTKDTS